MVRLDSVEFAPMKHPTPITADSMTQFSPMKQCDPTVKGIGVPDSGGNDIVEDGEIFVPLHIKVYLFITTGANSQLMEVNSLIITRPCGISKP